MPSFHLTSEHGHAQAVIPVAHETDCSAASTEQSTIVTHGTKHLLMGSGPATIREDDAKELLEYLSRGGPWDDLNLLTEALRSALPDLSVVFSCGCAANFILVVNSRVLIWNLEVHEVREPGDDERTIADGRYDEATTVSPIEVVSLGDHRAMTQRLILRYDPLVGAIVSDRSGVEPVEVINNTVVNFHRETFNIASVSNDIDDHRAVAHLTAGLIASFRLVEALHGNAALLTEPIQVQWQVGGVGWRFFLPTTSDAAKVRDQIEKSVKQLRRLA